MVAAMEKIFSFAKTLVSPTGTVVFVMQKILSDFETMVSIRRKVFSAMKKTFSVPSTNRYKPGAIGRNLGTALTSASGI
jgi:hypothetical protein